MSIQGMPVQEEVKVKCDTCGAVEYSRTEYADCECGGIMFNIKPFEAIYETAYELELGLV